jgi:geranylgeranyl transferase type-2 subunit alpha
VRLTVAQHGVPRVSGVVDKSEAAREKERKQIEQYRSLESEVAEKVCLELFHHSKPLLRRG